MPNIRQKIKKIRKQVLPFFIGMWIVLIPILFLVFKNPKHVLADWTDERWGYRTKITITNSGAATTDKKVKFDIDTQTLVTAGKILNTCADSRFTDAAGNELKYFLDSANGACNTNSTDYYVLLPVINGTPNTTVIYHYYGNPQATAGTEAAQFSQATFTQSGTTPGTEEISEGPQLYLRFDEGNNNTCSGGTNDACDASGKGTDAAGSGTYAWETSEQCVSGQCVWLNGTDGVFTVTNADNIDLDRHLASGFTVATWIKPNSTGENDAGEVFAKGANTYLRITSEGTDGLADITASLDLATSDATIIVSNVVSLNVWHSVAMTYTDDADDEISIYVDGKLVGTSTNGSGAPAADTNNLTIGGGTNNFKGFIDEFKIYKYERSAAQILRDQTAAGSLSGAAVDIGSSNRTSTSNGLVGYFPLDMTTGNALDSSGVGTTLASNNTPTYTNPGRIGNAATLNGTTQYFGATLSSSTTPGTLISATGWTSFTIANINSSNNVRGYTVATSWASALVRNFNMSGIPANSTINGIVVSAEMSTSSASGTGYLRSSLSWDGGTSWTGYSSTVSRANTADAVLTMGTSTDTWGRTWTTSELQNTTNFQLRLDGYTSNASYQNRVDYLYITVYYTPPTPNPYHNVRSVAFWTYPTTTTNGYIDLNGTQYINSTTGTLSAVGITNPTIYVNGVESSTITASVWNHVVVTSDTDIDTTGLQIGRIGSGSAYLGGRIDEVRLYNRTLTGSEVMDLYTWRPGPIAYWKMDEGTGTTLRDSSGNGYTSSAFSGTVTWSRGKYGQGIYVGGGTSVVRAAGVPYSGTNPVDYTAGIWFKYTADLTTYGTLMSQNAGTGNYSLALVVDGTEHLCYISITSTKCSTAVVNDGNWHYATAVKDTLRSRELLYLDGQLVNSGTTAAQGVTADMSFGNSGTSYTTYPYTGYLDEASYYNYAMTPEEIINLMSKGHENGGTRSGSAELDWTFDEMQGGTAQNSNPMLPTLTGTITGATRLAPANCVKGGCINIDTATDTISAGDLGIVDYSNSFSVSMWLNPQTLATSRSIISKYAASQYAFYVGTSSAASDEIRVYVASSLTDVANYYTTTDMNLTTGTWQHISVVYDGRLPAANRVKVYKNGIQVSGTVTGTIPATIITGSTSNVTIGDISGATGVGLLTYVDEAKLYLGPLSQTQIAADMNFNTALALGGVGKLDNEGFGGNSPVGEWTFDENTGTSVHDTSGTDITAASFTGTLTWARGKQGSSLTGFTTSNYVDIPDNTLLHRTGALTVEAWIKRSGNLGAWNTLVDKGAADVEYWLGFANDDTVSFCINPDTGDNSDSDRLYTNTTSTITDTKWHHVVGVYTGSQVRMYIDGVLDGTPRSFSGTLFASTGAVRIGESVSFGGYPFSGYIDDVKIYAYARSDAQIAYDYNRGAPSVWYKFDDCQGTTIHNSAIDSNGDNAGLAGTLIIGATGTNSSAGTCGSGTNTEAWNNGTNGRFGAAMDFDGSNDYVNANSVAALVAGKSFSISFWMKSTQDANLAPELVSFNTSTYGNRLLVYMNSGDILTLNDGLNPTDGSIIVDDGQWHHVVVVFDDANNMEYSYIDTKLDISRSTTASIAATDTFSIGQEYDAGPTASNFFDGQIDDLRVYRYAINSDEIKRLYNGGQAISFGD